MFRSTLKTEESRKIVTNNLNNFEHVN